VGGPAGTTASYGYDAVNRLVAASIPPGSPVATRGYQYDAADRLTQMSVGPTASTLAYNNAGELLSLTTGAATAQFTYDAQGNRTQRTGGTGQTRSYGWDQANRLTTYSGPAPVGSQQPTQASYTYDGDGLRQSKTVNGFAQPFTYDVTGRLPLILRDGTTSYVTGAGGLPLERIAADGTVTYFHQDRLGSTRALTNASGTLAATYAYDPYGNTLSITGSASTPFQYAGQYTDAETGLQYLRARYYDPSTAQFISRDPAVGTTRAPYAYVNDAPLNRADPTGLGAGAACVDDLMPRSCFPAQPILEGVASAIGAVAGWLFGWVFAGADESPPGPSDLEVKGHARPCFDDPTVSPGPDWEWRGPGDKGSWYNPKTGESLHPDLDHPGPIGPHYDYRAPNGDWYRWYPDGSVSLTSSRSFPQADAPERFGGQAAPPGF
jgi:RHS repeat-associated protein